MEMKMIVLMFALLAAALASGWEYGDRYGHYGYRGYGEHGGYGYSDYY